jgi:uncharacterized protein YvpB
MATRMTNNATLPAGVGFGNTVMGRKQLLGTGMAALMLAMVPAAFAQASSKPAGTAASTAKGPASALLQGYPQIYQQHSLSCEAAVASMATAGRLSEQQILDRMPRNQNPYLGFRGNVDGGQSLANGLQDYGIYAPPLARELQSFGYQAEAISGTSAPALLRHGIGVLGRPVALWVTHYLGDYTAITGYAAGQSFTLINGEHARLAIGYDAYGLHTLDPINGPQYDAWAAILGPWSRFGYMGIIVGAAQ